MSSKWSFISSQTVSSKNRITPPKKVREKISAEHEIDGESFWWYYDKETGYGLISNTWESPYIDFGRASLGYDNVVVIDSGLVDAAFEYLEKNDEVVFLGKKEMLEGEKKFLYVLHEEQAYDLLDDLESRKSDQDRNFEIR